MSGYGYTIEGMAAFLGDDDRGIALDDMDAVLKALRDAGFPISELIFAKQAAEMARERQDAVKVVTLWSLPDEQ